MVECARTSTQYHTSKGGERGKTDGVMGVLASNLQGLASNTIWRETNPVCKDKRGEGGTDEEQE